MMSGWQPQAEPPRPISELHSESAAIKYHNEAPVIAEVAETEQRPVTAVGEQGNRGHDVVAEAP